MNKWKLGTYTDFGRFKCCFPLLFIRSSRTKFPNFSIHTSRAWFSSIFHGRHRTLTTVQQRHGQTFPKICHKKHSKKYSFQKPSESKRTFLMLLGRLCVSATLLTQQSMEPKNSNQVKTHTIITNCVSVFYISPTKKTFHNALKNMDYKNFGRLAPVERCTLKFQESSINNVFLFANHIGWKYWIS